MAGNFSLPTVLANLTAGNQALSLVDGDFNACYNPLVSLNTYSNYFSDTGAANAYAITVSAPQTVTQSAGLRLQILITNANTGASTLQINALAVKNIKNIDGTALSKGQIPANAIIDVIYDGTQYLLIGATAPQFKVGSFTRDVSTASGTQAVTGVGFAPKALIFFACVNGTVAASWGMDDGVTPRCVFADGSNVTSGYAIDTAHSIDMLLGVAPDQYEGSVTTLGTDGFTVTWTKVNNPTGTATIFYMAFR